MVEGNESVLPTVTKEELLKICGKIDDNEASVLNGIPNRAFKQAVETGPDFFTNASKTYLKGAIFPVQLVLVPKPNKPPSVSCLPICLFNTMGKIMERAVYNKSLPIVEYDNELSQPQYGFQR